MGNLASKTRAAVKAVKGIDWGWAFALGGTVLVAVGWVAIALLSLKR